MNLKIKMFLVNGCLMLTPWALAQEKVPLHSDSAGAMDVNQDDVKELVKRLENYRTPLMQLKKTDPIVVSILSQVEILTQIYVLERDEAFSRDFQRLLPLKPFYEAGRTTLSKVERANAELDSALHVLETTLPDDVRVGQISKPVRSQAIARMVSNAIAEAGVAAKAVESYRKLALPMSGEVRGEVPVISQGNSADTYELQTARSHLLQAREIFGQSFANISRTYEALENRRKTRIDALKNRVLAELQKSP